MVAVVAQAYLDRAQMEHLVQILPVDIIMATVAVVVHAAVGLMADILEGVALVPMVPVAVAHWPISTTIQ
jgi:hypothetical protein